MKFLGGLELRSSTLFSRTHKEESAAVEAARLHGGPAGVTGCQSGLIDINVEKDSWRR